MCSQIFLRNEATLICIAELAGRLGCSEKHIWNLRNAGVLPPEVCIGKDIVGWRFGDIVELLNAHQEVRS